MTRSLRVLAAALAAVAVVTTAAAASQATEAPASCPALPGVQTSCGTIQVPLDRADPAAGQTAVRYLVARHRGPGRSAGTVALNEGGPGIAWITALAEQPQAFVTQFGALLDTHDVLLVDPRGTGGSGAQDCSALSITDIPPVRAQLLDAIQSCGQEAGTDTRYYTSAATADDLDAVRAHLGINKMDLLGESYGTYLMTVYAQRHPGRVRSVILSSAFPLNFDMWQRPNAAAMRQAIVLMCQRSGGKCDGNQILADLGTLAGRLRVQPVPYDAPDGHRLMDDTALAAITYDISGDRTLMGQLPGIVSAAVRGDYGPLTTMAAAEFPPPPSDQSPQSATPAAASPAAPAAASAADQLYGLVTWTSVSCNDYPTLWDRQAPVSVRTRQYDQARAQLNPAAFAPFTAQAWTDGIYNAGNFCLDWPDRAGPVQPTDLPLPNVPVLVLSGELDANTPTADGRAAAAQYPDARLIQVPNSGHVPEADPQANACVMGLQSQFLRTGKVADTRCLAAIPPVVVG
ncbi:MAG TPA: alpha/beta hydrolase [Pseudonocardiaceae bacterium]|jgi:pimeloyl-ACP methyl ester carboxylesterase|nr:alpha/beta hydrolase [Pseudonocardiaceae bacterium]